MLSRLGSVAILSLGAAVISGLANFLNKMAVTTIPDPVFYTFLKNGLTAVLLLAVLVFSSRWRELKSLNRPDWLKLLAIGIIGGSLPFALFFIGLSMTSAVSASLIHKTLFIWVALLAIPFLGERLGKIQWAALGLLLFGNFFLGSWQQLVFGKGELMIFGATLLWAVENIIAKRALQKVSSILLASARMILGSVILMILAVWQGGIGLISELNYQQWGLTIIIATLLFAFVLTWYTALARAPATLVASLLVPASLITSLLSIIFSDKALARNDIISSLIIIVALLLLIIGYRFKNNYQLKTVNSAVR